MHMRPLRTRPWVTALIIIGICLGTSLFVGLASLYISLGQPFATIAGIPLSDSSYEITSHIAGRVDESAVRSLRSLPGVTAATPIISNHTTIRSANREHGALFLASDCSAQTLIPDGTCRSLEEASSSSSGPGAPLVLSDVLADDLGVTTGDPLSLPGTVFGAAHVAAVLDSSQYLANGGYLVLTSILDAQDLLAMGPYLTGIYLSGDVSTATLQHYLGDGYNVSSPAGTPDPLLHVVQLLLLFFGVIVAMTGIMIAANSYTLSLDDRRRQLALMTVLGQTPLRLLGSLTFEGALLGLMAGLIAIPGSKFFGSLLTTLFGQSLLEGTGVILTPVFGWRLALLALFTSVAAGAIAAAVPAFRVIRDRGATAVTEQAGILPTHQPASLWLVSGLLLLPPGILLVKGYGQGTLPLYLGLAGLTLVLTGLLFGLFPLVPRLTRLLGRGARMRAFSLLAIADLNRDPLRLSAVVTVIGLGIGVATTNMLNSELIASEYQRQYTAWVGEGSVLYSATDLGVPTIAGVTPAAISQLERAGMRYYTTNRQAEIKRGELSIVILGTDSTPVIQDPNSLTYPARPLTSNEIAISTPLANELSLKVGDDVELPTLDGPVDMSVVSIGYPALSPGTGSGNIAVTSAETAANYWNAPITSLRATSPPVSTEGADSQLTVGQPDVRVYNALSAGDTMSDRFGRLMRPFLATGYALLAIAALAVMNYLILSLIQRRRLRAVLRFVGFSSPIEQRSLVLQALVMGILGAFFGVVAGSVVSWCVTTASPALLGTKVRWYLAPGVILFSVVAAIVTCLIAATIPALHSQQLDSISALDDDR